MTKRQRRRLAKAKLDVAVALRPHTETALLWKKLGKVDLSAFIKSAPRDPQK